MWPSDIIRLWHEAIVAVNALAGHPADVMAVIVFATLETFICVSIWAAQVYAAGFCLVVIFSALGFAKRRECAGRGMIIAKHKTKKRRTGWPRYLIPAKREVLVERRLKRAWLEVDKVTYRALRAGQTVQVNFVHGRVTGRVQLERVVYPPSPPPAH